MIRTNRRDILKLVAAAGAAVLPVELAFSAPSGLPLSAPVSISKVGLTCRDSETVARWYEMVVGLRRIPSEDATISMGVDGVVLLDLIERPEAELVAPSEAGLYHTAFLLPRRADLARWVLNASQARFPVDGVADHLVSEAIYLTDPEGNGVEIYADRSAEDWVWSGGQVEMASNPIDFDDLLASIPEGERPWSRAPSGTIVGHVHLRVGDTARAGAWWRETFSFDTVRARNGAEFLSTGGYHHHVAVNEWQSAGAGNRPEGKVGLAFVELSSRIHGAAEAHIDPWGTQIRLVVVS